MRRLLKKPEVCPPSSRAPYTLALDVGGTNLKASLLDSCGRIVSGPESVRTPRPSPPGRVLPALAVLCSRFGRYERVSVGFPGFVRGGVVRNAPNLGDRAWRGFPLERELSRRLGRPVRALNDADMQGLAAISGRGLELVVTLGTGVGTSLFRDGELLPHLELGAAFHPVPKGRTYNEYLGDAARRRIGGRRWTARVRRALAVFRLITDCDRVHVGGGNARRLRGPLGPGVRRVPYAAGMLGGIALWR